MSKKSKAPNTKKVARSYIKWLGSLDVVDKIFLGGSRSPLREKKHHKQSDWDLIVVSSIENLRLPNPRWDNRFRADILILTPEQVSEMDKIVEIYPKDKYKLLK